MKRLMRYTAAIGVMGAMGLGTALAGEASTSAGAANGFGQPGTAWASANYDGVGGQGFARTRTDTGGPVSIGRGLAVGFDQDGLDVSFSHALAPVIGPAYAGTFNMSIGTNGQVSTSYGGTLAQGGLVRTAEAGGTTRSDPFGANAAATAGGHTAPGGRVNSWTESNSSPTTYGRPVAYGARVVQGRPVHGGPAAQAPVRRTTPARRPISVQRSMLPGWQR